MTNGTTPSSSEATADDGSLPQCFVISPISTPSGYVDGHFTEVMEHIIKPACVGMYAPQLASYTVGSDLIHADIVRQLIEAPMAICDLSSLNPNVMFEVGARQAMRLPVVLIKDDITDRPFDVSGLRILDYSSKLWPSEAASAAARLRKYLERMKESESDDRKAFSVFDLIELYGPYRDALADTDPAKLALSRVEDMEGQIKALERALARTAQRMAASGAGLAMHSQALEVQARSTEDKVYTSLSDLSAKFAATEARLLMLEESVKSAGSPRDDS